MAAKGQPKSGGRKKGTPNKSSDTAADVFRKMRFDPLRKMVGLGQRYERVIREIEAEDKQNPGTKLSKIESYVSCCDSAFKVYKELLNYGYPKLKAIEITGEDGGPLEVNHLWGAPEPPPPEFDDESS